MPLPFFTAPYDLNSFEETFSTPAACDAGLRDVAAQMGTLNRFLADQKGLDPSASHRPRIEAMGQLLRLRSYLERRKAQLLRDPNAPAGSFLREKTPPLHLT